MIQKNDPIQAHMLRCNWRLLQQDPSQNSDAVSDHSSHTLTCEALPVQPRSSQRLAVQVVLAPLSQWSTRSTDWTRQVHLKIRDVDHEPVRATLAVELLQVLVLITLPRTFLPASIIQAFMATQRCTQVRRKVVHLPNHTRERLLLEESCRILRRYLEDNLAQLISMGSGRWDIVDLPDSIHELVVIPVALQSPLKLVFSQRLQLGLLYAVGDFVNGEMEEKWMLLSSYDVESEGSGRAILVFCCHETWSFFATITPVVSARTRERCLEGRLFSCGYWLKRILSGTIVVSSVKKAHERFDSFRIIGRW